MTAPANAAPVPATSGGRLVSGELRRLVAAHLAANAGDWTPHQIGKALGGRSAGAVANACSTLARAGHAELASQAPTRYRATATTASAAHPGATASGATAPGAAAAPVPATPPALAEGKAKGKGSKKSAAKKAQKAAARADSAAAAAAAALAPVTGPVIRPNGQTYHPRDLSGMPDVTALRQLRAAGVSALLYGPPGTGKTSVIEAAFADVITVQGDGDTTVADLVGEYTQTPDGRFIFVHGPLVRAMKEGRPLLLDDATLMQPSVLAVVYPAMDGRRQIIIKANGGEIIDAAPGFYVVAGHNPGVHGAILTEALSSRFAAQIQVSTDYDLADQLGVDTRAVAVARELASKHSAGVTGWAPQLRELLAYQKITGVLGADAAAGNLIGAAPEEDRPVVAAAVTAHFGKTLAPLALGARI